MASQPPNPTVTFAPLPQAPGRSCGECSLCCKLYDVTELEKPKGIWCKHCTPGKGCGIHASAPQTCRIFNCLWLADAQFPADWRPDRSKFVLTVVPGSNHVRGQVDPAGRHIWQQKPYIEGLRSLAQRLLEQQKLLVMYVDLDATVVTPDGPLPVGRIHEGETMRVEQVAGPRGPEWRAHKVASV